MKKLVFLALFGCGPNYDRTVISNVIADTAADVKTTRITVTSGGVVHAHIESFDSSDKSMSNDVSSDKPGVLTVEQGVGDHNYAFEGTSPGRATIMIKAEGELVLLIDARVDAQPPP